MLWFETSHSCITASAAKVGSQTKAQPLHLHPTPFGIIPDKHRILPPLPLPGRPCSGTAQMAPHTDHGAALVAVAVISERAP